MTSVKSPYNFVPAPKESEVFEPDWAKQVSHDIPFEDGESGEIELMLRAETPIFIRDGHAEGKDTSEFSHIYVNGKKKYIIPATSVKGMLRSVLEIMTRSRLNFVENDIFGLRDLNNKTFKNEVALSKNLKAGWLVKTDQGWEIQSCDWEKIDYSEIQNKLNIKLRNKSAIEKYKQLADMSQLTAKFSFSKKITEKFKGRLFHLYDVYRFDTVGNFEGQIVFYGDIQGKKREFIFSLKTKKKYDVPKDLMQRFEEIDKKSEEPTLWCHLRNRNDIDRYPVFFSEKNGKVIHFGFSRLYRMSNPKKLYELTPLKDYPQEGKKPDFAEVLFGFVDEYDNLKGRIFFSHLIADGLPEPISTKQDILGGPKASYYPFYLQQPLNGKDIYYTYHHKDAELAGFKRYPVHTSVDEEKKEYGTYIEEQRENDDVFSEYTPLPSGTAFFGKIRFHNLKKVEIGALLSAITFHNNHSHLFHSIGGAKPFGFGKVSIDILPPKLKHDWIEYLQAFETLMGKNWKESPQIKELFAMAELPANDEIQQTLKYPQLKLPNASSRDANEFINYKKRKQHLKPYSQINKS